MTEITAEAMDKAATAALDTPGVHPQNNQWDKAKSKMMEAYYDQKSPDDILATGLEFLGIPEGSSLRTAADARFKKVLAEHAVPEMFPQTTTKRSAGSRLHWTPWHVAGTFMGLVIGLVIAACLVFGPDWLRIILAIIAVIVMMTWGYSHGTFRNGKKKTAAEQAAADKAAAEEEQARKIAEMAAQMAAEMVARQKNTSTTRGGRRTDAPRS